MTVLFAHRRPASSAVPSVRRQVCRAICDSLCMWRGCGGGRICQVDTYVKHELARRRAVRDKRAYAHTSYLVTVARAAHAAAGIMLDAHMKQGKARRMPSAACQHSGRMQHCCSIGIRGAWPLAHATTACAVPHSTIPSLGRFLAACVLLFVHLGAYARVCNFYLVFVLCVCVSECLCVRAQMLQAHG